MAHTTNKLTVTFQAFPRLSPGNDDRGGDVFANGKRVGLVCRVMEWRDVGTCSVSYKGTVTGYEVTLYDGTLSDDPVFDTLAEARDYVRKFFANPTNAAAVFEAIEAREARERAFAAKKGA